LEAFKDQKDNGISFYSFLENPIEENYSFFQQIEILKILKPKPSELQYLLISPKIILPCIKVKLYHVLNLSLQTCFIQTRVIFESHSKTHLTITDQLAYYPGKIRINQNI